MYHAFEFGGFEALEKALDEEIEKDERDRGKEYSKKERSEIRKKIKRVFEVGAEAKKIIKENGRGINNYIKALALFRPLRNAGIPTNPSDSSHWEEMEGEIGREKLEEHELKEIEDVMALQKEMPLESGQFRMCILPFSEYITQNFTLPLSPDFLRSMNDEAHEEGVSTSALMREILIEVSRRMGNWEVHYRAVLDAAEEYLGYIMGGAPIFTYDDVAEIATIEDKIARVQRLGEIYKEREVEREEIEKHYEAGTAEDWESWTTRRKQLREKEQEKMDKRIDEMIKREEQKTSGKEPQEVSRK